MEGTLSFPIPPPAITLDIDDTCDRVHGHQQLSLFNTFYDTRCFLPIHVYHVESGRPVAVLLRPGKTPSGVEVHTMLKHLVRRIRRPWARTRLTVRGDSHYGRAEAMAWCEANGVDYIFGLAGRAALHGLAYEAGDDLKVRRADAGTDRMRGFASFDYAANCPGSALASWKRQPTCASTSPRPAPTPPCSACWPAASRSWDPDRRGDVPQKPGTLQPPTPTSKTSDPGTPKTPNNGPCALEINRQKRRLANKSG